MNGTSGARITLTELRDYSDPSTMPGVGEVGEWADKLKKSHPGWNDVLRKASKAPSSCKTLIKFMPRKSKSGIGSTNPVPFGMSNRVMKRKTYQS